MKGAPAMDESRQRLTSKRKFQVYLETRAPGANVGEILRRFGLHVNDLRRIEASVEGGAIEALRGKRNGHVPPEGGWPGGEGREGVIAVCGDAVPRGRSAGAACAVLGLSERRWRVWRSRARVGDFERHAVPAHVRPYNALTPQERELIRSAVGSAGWADASCRELSVKILEGHGV